MKNIILLMSLFLLAITVCFAGSDDTVEHVAIVETPAVPAATTAEVPAIKPAKPLVQIAILLDTSNSKLLLVTTMTSKSMTDGDYANIPAFDFEIGDPS